MKPQLQEFMGIVARNNIHTVHCIGHSLGGAIATICGDWIKRSYNYNTWVYTFGSPRVGLVNFSQECTTKLGSDHIKRCFHKSDPVPMIPTWPFVHTPYSGQDYFLPSPGLFFNSKCHDMELYCKSVDGKGWKELSGYIPVLLENAGFRAWVGC